MESDKKLHPDRKMKNKMDLISHKQKAVILIITLLFSLNSYSQKLIESRQTSYYTYIYKITKKEAKRFIKKIFGKLTPLFSHIG
jgi:hypothetical protein